MEISKLLANSTIVQINVLEMIQSKIRIVAKDIMKRIQDHVLNGVSNEV